MPASADGSILRTTLSNPVLTTLSDPALTGKKRDKALKKDMKAQMREAYADDGNVEDEYQLICSAGSTAFCCVVVSNRASLASAEFGSRSIRGLRINNHMAD